MPFGLPRTVRACLFDLDGVLTPTAEVHAAAWKEMFDAYLVGHARTTGTPFVAFDAGSDYEHYVDGKPRADGTRAFLASRGVKLPEGGASDSSEMQTVHGLAKRKNEVLQRLLSETRVVAFEGSVQYVHAVRDGGLRTAVVSSSRNCRRVLESAGITQLFDTVVDGSVAGDQSLAGKPAPDTYLAAARKLGVSPAQSAVFEDALVGVEAGRAGGFGYVVGVDRIGSGSHGAELIEHGANVAVTDLAELVGEP